MPIYRQDETGAFLPFEQAAPELEKQLEDWIEQSPHILLEGEPLAIIGRQTTTAFGKALDLLAVDQSGATVVIELKKGMAPREVIAQALEYTAWVDSQSQDDLDAIAQEYATRVGAETKDVAGLFDRAFGEMAEAQDAESHGESALSDHVTFNARQRVVIVAESFPGEMEQTLRYLRARLGVDVSAVRVNVHKLERETLLETEVVVGRERTGAVKTSAGASRPTLGHDEIRERVTTDFLRGEVDGLEDWISSLDAGLSVQHNKGTHHSIYQGTKFVGGYYFATQWIHFWLKERIAGDDEALSRLSNPRSVFTKPTLIAGNAATEADLQIFKDQLTARVAPDGSHT